MTLQITVRGTAQESYPAERALLDLAVSVEGADKAEVAGKAAEVQAPLIEQLEQLKDRGAVTHWAADRVHVYSHRPYDPQGRRLPVVHVARLDVSTVFVDFDRLSGFVDHWSAHDGVEIRGPRWDVTEKNRRAYESDVRRAAVDDAVHKAQGYANAVRGGRVVPIEFADPGMLDEGGGHPPRMMAMASAEAGPGITLTPEPIVIAIAVDARFTTSTER